jgi:dynactin complex subunit
LVVKQHIDILETTINEVNNSFSLLRDGVTKLQQSQGTHFDPLGNDIKKEKSKYKELVTKFNALQARVAQDEFELAAHQKLA